MLLTPLPSENSREDVEGRARSRDAAAGLSDDAAAGAAAAAWNQRSNANLDRGPEDAWILMGDLDAALFQAGVVSVWLETRRRPRIVFAAGLSALNALLAADGDALAFRVGWERLRAAHVLAAAALERTPLPGFLRRNGTLDAVRALAAPHDGKPTIRWLASGGFVDVAGGAAQVAALLDDVLHHRSTSHALAVAIEGAVASGARHVLVPGADERMVAQREVVRAIEDARADGVEVTFLPMGASTRPGVVGYLLPGLGRTDRLLRAGNEAARGWERNRNAANAATRV